VEHAKQQLKHREELEGQIEQQTKARDQLRAKNKDLHVALDDLAKAIDKKKAEWEELQEHSEVLQLLISYESEVKRVVVDLGVLQLKIYEFGFEQEVLAQEAEDIWLLFVHWQKETLFDNAYS